MEPILLLQRMAVSYQSMADLMRTGPEENKSDDEGRFMGL